MVTTRSASASNRCSTCLPEAAPRGSSSTPSPRLSCAFTDTSTPSISLHTPEAVAHTARRRVSQGQPMPRRISCNSGRESATAPPANANTTKPAIITTATLASEPDFAANELASTQSTAEFEPMFGRESEYNAILSFVSSRLQNEHCKALFIFGACGCGKTSTVLRAMRAISHRVMSTDRVVATRCRSSTGAARASTVATGTVASTTNAAVHAATTTGNAAAGKRGVARTSILLRESLMLSIAASMPAWMSLTPQKASSASKRGRDDAECDLRARASAKTECCSTSRLATMHNALDHNSSKNGSEYDEEEDERLQVRKRHAEDGTSEHGQDEHGCEVVRYSHQVQEVDNANMPDSTPPMCASGREKHSAYAITRHAQDTSHADKLTTAAESNTTEAAFHARRSKPDDTSERDLNKATDSLVRTESPALWSMAYFALRYPLLFAHLMPRRPGWTAPRYRAGGASTIAAAAADAALSAHKSNRHAHTTNVSATAVTIANPPLPECCEASVNNDEVDDGEESMSSCCAVEKINPATLAASVSRVVQAHYVNCADLSAAQLVEAIYTSILRVFPRPDSHTRALAETVLHLGNSSNSRKNNFNAIDSSVLNSSELKDSQLTSRLSSGRASSGAAVGVRRSNGQRSGELHRHRRGSGADERALFEEDTFIGGEAGRHSWCDTATTRSTEMLPCTPTRCSSSSSSSQHCSPLHVLVLDEVEYARPGSQTVIAQLASLSFSHFSSNLGMIFISNQRDLVHVPPMLLSELAFQAYSVDTLRQLAQRTILFHLEQRNSPVITNNTRNCAHTSQSAKAHSNSASNRRGSRSAKADSHHTPTTRSRASGSKADNIALSADPVQVTVSPSLYEYIARRVLFNDSGDVRQLMAMCRCVIDASSTEEVMTKNSAVAALDAVSKKSAAASADEEGVQQQTILKGCSPDSVTPPSPFTANSPSTNSDSEAAATRRSRRSNSCHSRVSGAATNATSSSAASIDVFPMHSVEQGRLSVLLLPPSPSCASMHSNMCDSPAPPAAGVARTHEYQDETASLDDPPQEQMISPLHSGADDLTEANTAARFATRRVFSSSGNSRTTTPTVSTVRSAPLQISTPPPLTLARGVKALQRGAVSEQLHVHISTMPEQMLYVLCCLIVLTLRNDKERQIARNAIAGVTSTSHHYPSSLGTARGSHFGVGNSSSIRNNSSSSVTSSAGIRSNSAAHLYSTRSRSSTIVSSAKSRCTHAGTGSTNMSNTLRVREVHQIYTALMGERHFPAMNAAGVTTAIDGLADLGILTRPQRRGNEEVFTFNGAWSVDAMQEALTRRGEDLQREMTDCGLDGSENKFVAVLCDLKRLTDGSY